jgi:uncharacterized membrane protein YkvA (DUF1232 family)
MFERTDPRTLAKWMVLAAAIYFLFPYDLLPDFLGLPGRVDDLLVMAWLAWAYRSHVRQFVARVSDQQPFDHHENAEQARAGACGARQPSASREGKRFDAYEVLGIDRSASIDAIRDAYRSKMQEYHPDKVAHLGSELQELALEKSQQIQRAYRQLTG